MTGSRIKVIVNAIPLVNVNTGISRYLRCLYTEMERCYGDRLEIGYFDGRKVSSRMPIGPANLGQWTRGVDLFWKMPVYPALVARLGIQVMREVIFRKYSRDFDIYHEAGFFPFCASTRVKTIFTLCDLSLIRFPQYHPRERVRYSRLFFRRRCLSVDHFLTISGFVAKEMRRVLNIGKEKITKTHLAHDAYVFYPRSYEETRIFIKDHALPDKYFLFVGSGDPRKNMDIIPKALKRAGANVPVVVAGWSGWSSGGVSERVIPLGFVNDEDLARAYSGAIGMIFPSSYEGFGLPVLEAMACGCPVVTTKETSLPEVAGNAALYMKDPRDADNLADILKDLVENRVMREQLAHRGLKQAKAFSWKKTAQLTFESFLEVLHR